MNKKLRLPFFFFYKSPKDTPPKMLLTARMGEGWLASQVVSLCHMFWGPDWWLYRECLWQNPRCQASIKRRYSCNTRNRKGNRPWRTNPPATQVLSCENCPTAPWGQLLPAPGIDQSARATRLQQVSSSKDTVWSGRWDAEGRGGGNGTGLRDKSD